MRELKFRAWDRINKNMCEVTSLNFYDECVYLNEHADGSGTRNRLGEVELMQYTGLKDKNGVEIYEGDMLLYPDTYTEEVDVGVGSVPVAQMEENSFYPVVFFEGAFGLNVLDSELLYNGFQSLREVLSCVEYVEVIGNIYQNKELLK